LNFKESGTQGVLGAGSTRFDIHYQKNIQEIDNKVGNVIQSQNKLDYLRKKFRSDINQITNNLMNDLENEVEMSSAIGASKNANQNKISQ